MRDIAGIAAARGWMKSARGLTLAALGVLVLAACSEPLPIFSNNRVQAKALALPPSTLPGGVAVAPLAEAPAQWRLDEKIAQSLAARGVQARVGDSEGRMHVLRGGFAAQPVTLAGVTEVTLAWELKDPNGAIVFHTTQTETLPEDRYASPSLIELRAMADRAADKLRDLIVASAPARGPLQASAGTLAAGLPPGKPVAFDRAKAHGLAGDLAESKPRRGQTPEIAEALRQFRPASGPTVAALPPPEPARPAAPAQMAAAPAGSGQAIVRPLRDERVRSARPAVAEASGGYWVQVGALRTPEATAQLAERAASRHADVFGGRDLVVHRKDVPALGTFYRARGGPFEERSAADRACIILRQRGEECWVSR